MKKPQHEIDSGTFQITLFYFALKNAFLLLVRVSSKLFAILEDRLAFFLNHIGNSQLICTGGNSHQSGLASFFAEKIKQFSFLCTGFPDIPVSLLRPSKTYALVKQSFSFYVRYSIAILEVNSRHSCSKNVWEKLL